MNEKNEKKSEFYLGLDIGTESVGFALTDENYEVCRVGGKRCMGVRQFEEAKTAKERRVYRANKVRKNRRKYRLTLLQELFNQEISKVDPYFYIRLGASNLWASDKKTQGILDLNSLFADTKYEDKDYFKQFKTIFHLRYYLMNEDNWKNNKIDIRLLYLACHHIIKSRGHFVFESSDFNLSASGKELFAKLNDHISLLAEIRDEVGQVYSKLNLEEFKKIEDLVKDKSIKLKNLPPLLTSGFGLAKSKFNTALIRVILGYEVKIIDLFPNVESEDIKKIALKKFENDAPQLTQLLGEDFTLVSLLKDIYDWFVLINLLNDATCISQALIRKYDKHHEDLQTLKQIVKSQAPEKYHDIFISDSVKDNYAAYIGSTLNRGKKIVKKVTHQAFCEFLKKQLQDILPPEIVTELEEHTFLPKLKTGQNSVIPYQLHKTELETILANAVKHYDIDAPKIVSLLTFRVPYYVGRLNTHFKNDPNRHVWIEKREEYQNKRTKITPWNFQEIVDLEKSAENFIIRMVSRCTYLNSEVVLPKNSLVYSKYMVLNELNNLIINHQPISVETKQKIYTDLFMVNKNVTMKALFSYLGKDVVVQGIDVKKGFNSNLTPFILAKNIFNDSIDSLETQKIVENVILWQALFTDKKQVQEKIKKTYDSLSKDIVKKLTGLSFSGFGNLSAKFLTSNAITKKSTGEVTSIIDLLWDTNQNLMKIIHNPDYNVEQWIIDMNGYKDQKIDYNAVKELYVSPSVKRSIWQTIKVVDEIIKLSGKTPSKIFVEVNRKEEEKKPTKSRRKFIEGIWKDIKDATIDFKDLRKKLDDCSDAKLRSKKLYLYFLQCGKCAYSGRPINFEDLFNDNKYDIDHIIPRALKKDDSFNNLVLVEKNLNNSKSIIYPLSKNTAIWSKKDILIPMWTSWCKEHFKEKLSRLTRTTELTTDELEGFIARQLVFTGQATTCTARLLKQKYKNSEIVYSKAINVSEFRNKFDFLKCREINDLHHAHDAYLNVVVGNVYNTRFNHNKYFYIKQYEKTNEQWRAYATKHLFEYNIDNCWDTKNTLKTITKYLSFTDYPISKMTTENKGKFYDLNIIRGEARQKDVLSGNIKLEDFEKKKVGLIKTKAGHPLNDSIKYGSYSKVRPAYFMIIEYDLKNGQRQKAFHPVNMVEKETWEKYSETQKIEVLSKEFTNPIIIFPKILINTLFNIAGIRARLAGWDGHKITFHNADQIYLKRDTIKYIRSLLKYKKRLIEESKGKDKKKIEDKKDSDNDNDILKSANDEISENEIILSNNNQNTNPVTVSKEKNQKLWDTLLEKINILYGNKMQAYKGRNFGLPDLFDKLSTKAETFSTLSIDNQVILLLNLIDGMGCNAKDFNLKILGESANTGKILPNKKINYPISMIKQSITGLKENRIIIQKED